MSKRLNSNFTHKDIQMAYTHLKRSSRSLAHGVIRIKIKRTIATIVVFYRCIKKKITTTYNKDNVLGETLTT